MKKSVMRSIYQRANKNLLQDQQLSILKMYFDDERSIKDIGQLLNLSIPVTRNLLAKALYECRKSSNDPEYLKALNILYGSK